MHRGWPGWSPGWIRPMPPSPPCRPMPLRMPRPASSGTVPGWPIWHRPAAITCTCSRCPTCGFTCRWPMRSCAPRGCRWARPIWTDCTTIRPAGAGPTGAGPTGSGPAGHIAVCRCAASVWQTCRQRLPHWARPDAAPWFPRGKKRVTPTHASGITVKPLQPASTCAAASPDVQAPCTVAGLSVEVASPAKTSAPSQSAPASAARAPGCMPTAANE